MLQVSGLLNIFLMLLHSIESAPVTFEFHHRESFSLTDDQDWGDNEDYGVEKSGRVRRSAAKWAPDYDLYAQWAEEYYRDDNPPVEEQPTSTNQPLTTAAATGVSGEGVLRTLLYLTYAVGVVLLYLILKRIVRWSKCCDASSIRKRARRAAANLVPGVYIHTDGRTEHYPPTHEELEAAKELSKLLFSIY